MDNQYLELGEVHALCEDMLKLVDHICREEGIQYFLSGGTLLGAIRHKGFIPWDDDIDLMMPRPEFNRFLEVAPRYMNKRYSIAYPRVSPDYAHPWLRIHDNHTVTRDTGMQKARSSTLFLDIFPIDGLPKSEFWSDMKFRQVRAHDILLKCSRKKELYDDERLKWLKRILIALTRIRRPEDYALSLSRCAARIPFEKAKYAGVLVITHYGSRERMPAEVFRGAVNVPFEDGEYPAPIGWDTYLRGLYGDYMQLPPEEKRHSDHNLDASIISEEDRT